MPYGYTGISRLTEIFGYIKDYVDSKATGGGTSEQSSTTVFNSDGSITETFDDHTTTTTFGTSNIVETSVYSDKTVTVTTTFNSDGSISKVVS